MIYVNLNYSKNYCFNLYSNEYIQEKFIHNNYLKELFSDNIFACDNCPLCGSELKNMFFYPNKYEECKHGCYYRNHTIDKRIATVRIFEHFFYFSKYYSLTGHDFCEQENNNDINLLLFNVIRLKQTIEFYRENDRYLMQILLYS